MSYIVPTYDSINFVVRTGYTAPTYYNINFIMGAQEGVTSVFTHFEKESSFNLDDISWTYPLDILNHISKLHFKNLSLHITLPTFQHQSQLNLSLQTGIKFPDFIKNTNLYLYNIAGIPENTDVISPWPFIQNKQINKVDISLTLPIRFYHSVELATPVIIAAGVLTLPGIIFQKTNLFNTDIKIKIKLSTLIKISQALNLSSISFIIEGELFLPLNPFISNKKIIFQLQQMIPLNPFTVNYSLLVNIIHGKVIFVPSFQSLKTISGIPQWVLIVLNFNAIKNIAVNLHFILVSNFEHIPELVPKSITVFETDLANIYYFFILTGQENGLPDIEIPISSFQASIRNGEPTYLQVVIPGIDYAEEVSNRPDGIMQVYMAYKLFDQIVRKELFISANLENIRLDQGINNISITLSGHKTETYESKEVIIKNVIYKSIIDGKYKFRFAEPIIDLHPGDSITVEDVTFIANLITYYIKVTKSGIVKTMEISQ